MMPIPSQNVSEYDAESPQPKRAISFPWRSVPLRSLTALYQSSCISPHPQVDVPRMRMSYESIIPAVILSAL